MRAWLVIRWMEGHCAPQRSRIEFAERAGVRARARALGEAMAREDGLATAVPPIETLTSR